MNYDINYFITKFSSIPGENWCSIYVSNGYKACALGHCGVSESEDRISYVHTEESMALVRIFGTEKNVTTCNDVSYRDYIGATPKERILNHLKKLKELEEKRKLVNFAERMINEEVKEGELV